MKKRKKLFISIFSIFAFFLSIFSISNVYAYEQGINENELVNTTNYCNLTDFTFTSDSVNFTNTYTIIDNYTFTINENSSNDIGIDKYIQFDLSSLIDGKYMFIMLNNYLSHTTNISGTNGISYSFYNSNDAKVGNTYSYFSSNIQNFTYTKNSSYQKIRIYLHFADTISFRNKDLGFKIYLYKIDDIDNQVNSALFLKSSLFDYMFSSNSDYIDIDLYNSLLEQYNQLNSGFNELGFLYYLDHWNSSYTDDEFDISSYVDGSRLNLYELVAYNNTNYAHNMLSFYFNETNNKLLVGNLNFIFSGGVQCEVRIVNQDGNTFIFQATDNLVVNQDFIITNDLNDYLWESITEIHFVCNSPDDVNGLNFNVEYTIGFNDGYNSGYTYGYTSGYNSGLVSNNSYYRQLYNELLIQYNDLQKLYNDYVNGNVSFNTLVWNIATIPFESFKQIWNVDLLGLNIGNFVTALMFVGVVVYIWKKFL